MPSEQYFSYRYIIHAENKLTDIISYRQTVFTKFALSIVIIIAPILGNKIYQNKTYIPDFYPIPVQDIYLIHLLFVHLVMNVSEILLSWC
jgi:hypothetical protein